MQHPDIGQSFLSMLGQAVGKASLAPPEVARAYLTDKTGQVAKSLSVYTFDKKELERLRSDILANPEKYEKALKHGLTRHVPKLGDKMNMKLKKKEEYDYWFRVLNEGLLPQDSLPYYKQLIAYQDFVNQVEQRAFDTLKLTVQRLLMDFENHDGGISGKNEVTNFSQKEKESKHQALRRLMATLNENEDIATKELPTKSSS